MGLVGKKWELVSWKDFKENGARGKLEEHRIIEGKEITLGSASVDGVKVAIRLKDDTIEAKCERCSEQPCRQANVFWFKKFSEVYFSKLPMPKTCETKLFHEEEEKVEKARQEAKAMLKGTVVDEAEKLDEIMILEKWIEGTEPLIYKIPTKRGERKILSVKGYVQAALMQGHIEVISIDFEMVRDRLIAIAKVRDIKHNLTMTGIAERYFNEEYKYTILARKAVRNALKNIIKPEIEQRIIAEAERLNSGILLKEAATP